MCNSSESTSWASVRDVQNLLRASGILKDKLTPAQAAFDWERAIKAAISRFERETKRVPFAMEAEPTTVPIVIDRPSRMLSLPASFAEITKVEIQAIGSNADPDLLEEGVDYDLSPVGADLLDKPFTALTLYPYLTRRTRSKLLVTGKRGYAKTLPDLAYQAVLEMAAVQALAVLTSATPAGVERKKAGALEIEYATSVTERMQLANRAETNWNVAIQNFKWTRIA